VFYVVLFFYVTVQISVLLYSFSVLLYSSVLLCCSLLLILLCSSSYYICVLDCIYCTLTLPPGVNPIAVNIHPSIHPSICLSVCLSISSECASVNDAQASRPAHRTTRFLIQCATGPLSPGVKRTGREASHAPASSAKVK
jgi:hypothetical protein